MQIYERIFDILQRKSMTQKDLSDKTGISQSTISDWKNKKMNPSADKIMIICDALGVSPYTILSGADDKYNETSYVIVERNSEEYKLIESYRKSSSEAQRRLLGYMQAVMDEQADK